MIYLMSQMQPKLEYKVAYVDRVYGWKSLYVRATSEQEAIREAISHLGHKPDAIRASLAIDEHGLK